MKSKKLLNLLNKPVQPDPVSIKVKSKKSISENKNNIEPNESDISENEDVAEVTGIFLYYIVINKTCFLYQIMYLFKENPAMTADEKRGITYQIAKNKGLTPRRKKELRNPRVKNRMKFRKAKIRRKGQVCFIKI